MDFDPAKRVGQEVAQPQTKSHDNGSGASKFSKITGKVPKIRRSNSKKLITIIIALIIALLVVGGGVLFKKYDDSRKEAKKSKEEVQRLSNPQEAAKLELEILLERVGKLVDLPNEQPTLATVQDASKLKEQAFFASAENNDKVLIYTKAKKAFLFRPSTNKIINIAPVNIGNN